MRSQLSKILAIVMVLAMAVSMFSFSTFAAEDATVDAPTATADEATPDESYDIGDVDLDGAVTVKDATLVQKYAADMATLDELQLALADVCEDGKINVKDATAIQKIVAEIVDPSTPDEPTPDEPTPDEPIVDDSYIVAGVDTLCGSTWDGNDTDNIMTKDGDVYTKTFTAVAEGSGYQFKVVKNGSEWFGDATGNNITFNVNVTCDVTVTYNPATGEITVTGDGVELPTGLVIDCIHAVGNGDEDWLNGVSWDPANDLNLMTEVSEGIYEITFTDVPAFDNYQVKFAANDSWADNWGGTFAGFGVETEAVYNAQDNITVVTEYELVDITLTLNLTAFDYATKTGATFTITAVENVATPDEATP